MRIGNWELGIEQRMTTNHFSPSTYRLLLVLMVMLTACGNQSEQSSSQQETSNDLVENPYIQFSKAVTSLEAIPEAGMTTTQSRRKQAINNQSTIKLPQVNPLEVEGDIAIAGTTIVNPLNELMYQRFVEQGYGGIINISGIGSNPAIQLFCQEGKIDLLTLARPLREDEIATCRANNRQPIQFAIGKDAVVIVVNKLNTFVKKVTLSKLADIFTVEKWSEVDPDWSDESIEHFTLARGADLDLMAQRVFQGDSQAILTSPNTSVYQQYEPMLQALTTTPDGVAFMSYSIYKPASGDLRAISLEGAAASPETAENDTYPLGRILYIYTDAKQLKQKPQVSSLINFYLTHIDEEIEQAKLFPLSQQELDKAKITWLEAMGIKDYTRAEKKNIE